MIDEFKLLEEIRVLRGHHKDDVQVRRHNFEEDHQFIRTDIAAIIPDGCGLAYSVNEKNQINGIKMSRIPPDSISAVLEIIPQFKFLRRLVIYADGIIELPVSFGSLSKLEYISTNAFSIIPTNVLEILYNYININRIVDLVEEKSFGSDQIVRRLNKFREINPSISITREEIISEVTSEDSSIVREARLYCVLTEETRERFLSQKGIFISEIESLVDPPFEIVRQGREAISKYCKEKKQQGTGRLYEAKMVIVGAGESGKTTLIKKLQNPHHPVPNAEDKRTEGIRVITYPFTGDTKFGRTEIQAHVWDFGGQELYHTTHQLFLTADTLYILLNDNRKNDTDFYYWLNIVTLRAGNSPILMVFNAKDNATRQIIPGEEIYDAFPNLIKKSIDVNFADNNIAAIANMKQTIEGYFSNLEVLGKPFPTFWVNVREVLSKMKEEHINWNVFATICGQYGIDDASQMRVLINTLNNLGVLSYFSDVFGLEDLIILKSQWCVDAIYSALDSKDIIDSGGKFDELTLSKKWAGDRFAGNHLQLLKIMQHFDLCYKIDGTDKYIAPQLLPLDERRLSSVSSWNIVFQFHYEFMPAGLVTRLIARMSRYIKNPHAWRTGVILEWDDETFAEIIEHQLTRKIVIKINGPERKRRLQELRICLCDLHGDFKGIKFKEFVTCNCTDCKKGGDVTIFELKNLEDDANYNDEVRCKNGTRKILLAKDILNGISYRDIPRIFISYSHKNEKLKEEFRTMIAPMEREGHWKVWDDRWLLPGDQWNQEILRHLAEANVVVLMLTAEFFQSNYIYDIELSRAIQKHEAGDALLIGIIVDDCMWEETPLSRIQMLPKDGKTIKGHKNKAEIWKTVANKIKETVLVRQSKNNRSGGWR